MKGCYSSKSSIPGSMQHLAGGFQSTSNLNLSQPLCTYAESPAQEPNTIDIIVREGLGQSAVTAIESMYGCGIKDCGMLTLLKLAEVAEQLIMEELLSDIAEALNACQISNEELYYYFNKLLFIEKIQ